MAQRITHISVGQTAKMFGVLYAIMGLLVMPFFFVAAKFAPPARPVRKRLFASRNEAGAFWGFALFGAWTLVEIAMLLAR